MIRTVRTAAAAAAMLFLIAFATPAAAADFDHGTAMVGVSPLGLNATAPVTAAASPSEHLVAMAGLRGPEPRSLEAEIEAHADSSTHGREEDCLANAVYFEARGESLEGQLAVAEVVMNRAVSGRYPATLCGVVVQPAQFSFVRRGVIPAADRSSGAWRRAVGVARLAQAGSTRLLPRNVLWYHANYVSPSWGRRLARSSQIGAHIFYR